MDHSIPRKGRHLVKLRVFALVLSVFALAGCESIDTGAASRAAMNETIRKEPPGNYFVGRRMYKVDYKVWGWVREPGKPWSTAKLVMLNEQRVLAPDRARNKIGSDNDSEYRLTGYFSGDTVYEPASNGFYPEFILLGAEVKSTNPPNIYQLERQKNPNARILQPPL
ncbi:MAG: hypothetical protein WCE49_00210 [Terrimicrobiaceae bacterium]